MRARVVLEARTAVSGSVDLAAASRDGEPAIPTTDAPAASAGVMDDEVRGVVGMGTLTACDATGCVGAPLGEGLT
jgi:hypothetical protein